MDVGHVLAELAPVVRLGAGAIALYGAGSLAVGDYRPGVSDLDLVAVVSEPLSDGQQGLLANAHRRLMAEHAVAAKLHCAYVPVGRVADLAAAHPTWAHGRFVSRPLAAFARAELFAGGVVAFGPAPAQLLPPVSRSDVEAAARTELVTIWRPNTRRPWLWWEDIYVDLGLVTLARAETTLSQGRLLTKTEAIERLPRLGVPATLVAEIACRRRGERVETSPAQRVRRAVLVRRLVATGIDNVLAASDGPRSGQPR